MFKPREKWFRGSIFFSLKSLLVRRGESWIGGSWSASTLLRQSWERNFNGQLKFLFSQQLFLPRRSGNAIWERRKAKKITSPPSENLIFIHPDSFLRREVFLSPPPLRHQGWAYALTWWQRLWFTDLNTFFCSRSQRLTRLTDSFDLTC